MFNKSFGITILTAVAAMGIIAQSPEARSETAPRTMSWSFAYSGGYLGVQTVEVSNENFGKYGLPSVRGVAVEKVLEGSPAERAGIRAGDVIVRLNGDEITSTQKLTRLVSEISPDHTARITVFRGGSELELSASIGKRPMPKFEEGELFGRLARIPSVPVVPNTPRVEGFPAVPLAPGEPGVYFFGSGRRIGVGLTPLTKDLAQHFGVENGSIIDRVTKDSPAEKAGLRVGDIVVEIEGRPVNSEFDIIRALGAKKEGDVSLTIVRDRSRQTVTVTPVEMKDEFERFFKFDEKGEGPGNVRMVRPAVPPKPPAPVGPGFFNRVV